MAKKLKSGDIKTAELREVLGELANRISNFIGTSTECTTEVPGLSLYRSTAPTAPNSCTYEPSLLVIPQGRKRVDLAGTNYVFGQSRFLLTSLDLPIVSQVVTASEEAPYLAFFLKLEIATVRDTLNTDEVHVPGASAGTRAMVVGDATAELIRSCSRMLDLLHAPRDIPFLGKLVQREIIYRLLQGTQGDRLRAIATLGEQSNRTAKAVTWLRANYDKPLRVEHLATIAGMSLATLHRHFRALTAMSPLQYQKQLRLRNARHRMLTADLDASSAAFAVGYESASQFSREYSRHFGRPPMKDVQAVRAANQA